MEIYWSVQLTDTATCWQILKYHWHLQTIRQQLLFTCVFVVSWITAFLKFSFVSEFPMINIYPLFSFTLCFSKISVFSSAHLHALKSSTKRYNSTSHCVVWVVDLERAPYILTFFHLEIQQFCLWRKYRLEYIILIHFSYKFPGVSPMRNFSVIPSNLLGLKGCFYFVLVICPLAGYVQGSSIAQKSHRQIFSGTRFQILRKIYKL